MVEGHISNVERPQQIKLSRTAPLDERGFIAESDADVHVESGVGEKIQFNEVMPGIYESLSFAGGVGEGYTLFIKTRDGREYKSPQVVLKDVPPIGNISAEFVTSPERGIQISVHSEDPLNNTHYYRWDYIETFEIQTPFPSNFVVLPGADEATWRTERVDQCWANDTLRDVLIKSTRGQDQDKVVAFPLRFIPEESYEFRIKYSLLLQQFALSEQAFNYWENIRIFNETQGTLADVQPGTLNSNVLGVTDPSETVLGYFDASAVAEQRVFFDYRDFIDAGYVRPTYRSSCLRIVPMLIPENEIAVYMSTPPHSDQYAIWEAIGLSPNALFELLPKSCCDCTNSGTNVKPPFWE